MFKSRHLDQLGSKGDFAPFFYSKNGGWVSLLPRFRKKPRLRYHLFAGVLAALTEAESCEFQKESLCVLLYVLAKRN